MNNFLLRLLVNLMLSVIFAFLRVFVRQEKRRLFR